MTIKPYNINHKASSQIFQRVEAVLNILQSLWNFVCVVTKWHLTKWWVHLNWFGKTSQHIHYKIVSLTYNALQTSESPSYIRQLLMPGSAHSSSYLSSSQPPVSFSLKFCNRSLVHSAPALWNGIPKDIHQFAHRPIPSLNFTAHPLAPSSATFHSWLKTELLMPSYPDSISTPQTSTKITDCNRSPCCHLSLTFPDLLTWHWNEKPGYCGWYSAGEQAGLPEVTFAGAGVLRVVLKDF